MTLEFIEPAAAATVAPAVTDTTAAPAAADTTAAPAETAKPSIDDTLRATWDKINPRREATGRFAARDGATEPTDDIAVPAATEPSDHPEEAKAETVQQAASSIAPPHSWSAEAKAKWATVPPELQTVIAKRETEAHEAITRAGQQIKMFEPMARVIEQNADTFRRNNLAPQDGVERLLAVEQWLATDPASAIGEIARAYGVDLQRLNGDQPAATDGTRQGTQPDPLVSTLQSQLAATAKEVNQLKSYLTAQQRTQHETEQFALDRQIADFAKDQKHPHFETVRKTMAKLMEADDGLSMADAYERATYAIPETRQRILADQRKTDEDKTAKEKAARLDAAKKAGTVNVKSTTAAGTAPKTMDDTLREIARARYGT
jgi:hypothetical protein